MAVIRLTVALCLGCALAQDAGGAASAGKLRSAADVAFTEGRLDEAVRLYSQVIRLEPKNERNYYKRFRAYQRQRKFQQALQDLNAALAIKPQYKQCVAGRAKVLRQLGRCEEALADLGALSKLDPGHKDLVDRELVQRCADSLVKAGESARRGDLPGAREALGVALEAAEAAAGLLMQRGDLSMRLGDLYEAAADYGRAIKLEGDNIAALQKRGEAYYALGEHELAVNHFREGLRMDPEHPGCKALHKKLRSMMKKEAKGAAAEQDGDFPKAIEHYRAAIAVDPGHRAFVAPTLLRISRAYLRAKSPEDARDAARESITVDETAAAWVVLSEAHQALDSYEEAVRNVRRALELEETKEHQELLHKAEVALEQSKKRNYYKDLGVRRSATQKEIKKAYRDAALRWHPDKVKEEDKDKAEEQFAKIATAYEVLSDEEMRARYDRGEDPLEQNGGGGGAQRGHPFHFHQQHRGHPNFGGGGNFHFRFN